MMPTTTSRLLAATVACGLLLATRAAAHGRTETIKTLSVIPDLDGYVSCVVQVSTRWPVDLSSVIANVDGVTVTEFGSSFRASPAVTQDGNYYAEDRVGSTNDGARYCKVTIRGASRRALRDASVSLTAYDANGVTLVTVTRENPR